MFDGKKREERKNFKVKGYERKERKKNSEQKMKRKVDKNRE